MKTALPVNGIDLSRAVDAVFINSPLKNYDLAPRLNDFTLPVLGLGYIATYAKSKGLNVGVLDAESLGLGISKIIQIVNELKPRWIGLNLLAPTYRHSLEILRGLNPDIMVMLGGHQAKAMPLEILADHRIPRIDAMILGEAEYRVAAILQSTDARAVLPKVRWRDKTHGANEGHSNPADKTPWLAPTIDELPFIDRSFLHNDPFPSESGHLEANLVGSRGCPYDCSFCGAAKSVNPDISIRARTPENIAQEMQTLAEQRGVSAFRFVDDLFLANTAFINRCLPYFCDRGTGQKFVWDATGRINILSRASDSMLDLLKQTGCREIAVGIESGSPRLLEYMGKRISPDMTARCVTRLTARGINVKGYVILGFPTETITEMNETVHHVEKLWNATDDHPGHFRCSAFEFRPYPGTPEWQRLLKTGKYTADQLLLYEHVDLTDNSRYREMLERDEFNFSVNQQFGEAPVSLVRQRLAELMTRQKQRLPHVGKSEDHVQRLSMN